MLTSKEKMILQYLYQHRGEFSTSKVLGDYLSYSDRTIRTYIKKLSSDLSLDETGFQIISKQGFGYQLDIVDEDTYHQFLIANDLTLGLDYSDIDNRHKVILNKLIFEEEAILFDDLAEQLFISHSTLSSDFKKIREILANYQLSIESKPYRGVYVLGKEQDKRHFIMDYFFGDHFHQNMTNFVGNDMLALPISLEELTIIVLDECRNQGLKLSDYAIQNLVIHLGLAIQRFQKGFRIAPIDLDTKKYAKEFSVAKNITKRLSQRFKEVDIIPDEETAYIALHLLSKSMANEQSPHRAANLRQEISRRLEDSDAQDGYDFLSDLSLIEGLVTHLEILLERLTNDIHLDNPLLDDIKQRYPDMFQLTKGFMSGLSSFQTYSLSEDEIAYVALHFMASIERHKEKTKCNLLVICATGFGSAQMLKNRIMNELGQWVTISDVIGYYDLTNDKLEGIDMIMSTIDLSNLVFTVPVQTVSVFLPEQEVLATKAMLSNLRRKNRYKQVPQAENHLGKSCLRSVFDEYFSRERFVVLEEADKADLLAKMVGLVVPDDSRQREILVDFINKREQLSTVVFDQDIAVPHPLKPVTEKHHIAVAIIKKGVVWEDGFEAVKLVFLVSPSLYSNQGLKDITNRIVDLVDLADIKDKLIHAKDFESFKAIFLGNERS